MKTYQPHQSSLSSVTANVAAMLCCLLPWTFGFVGLIIAVVFYATESNSGLVKFYAAQSIVLYAVRVILYVVLAIISGIITAVTLGVSFFGNSFNLNNFGLMPFGLAAFSGGVAETLLQLTITIGSSIIFIMSAVKAYRWQQWPAPLIGGIAEDFAARGKQPLYNGDGPVPPQAQQHKPYTPPPPHGQPGGQNGNPAYPPSGQPYNQQYTQPPIYQNPTQQGYGSPHGSAPAAPGQPQQPPPYYPSQPQPGTAQQGFSQQQPNPFGQAAAPVGPAPAAPPPRTNDPNSQLPPEMRDEPLPKDMYE